MTIVRARDRVEAEAIFASDPFHVRGLRTFEVREWQLNEGRVSVHIDFSDQAGGLDRPRDE